MRYLLLWLYVGLSGLVFGQTNSAELGSAAQDAHPKPMLLAYAFGNARRNSVYGAGMQTLDFALVRDFTVRVRAGSQFRAKLFNRLNPANRARPIRFVNTPQLGSITEGVTPGRRG